MIIRTIALFLALASPALAQTPTSPPPLPPELPDAPSTTSNAHAPVVPTGPTVLFDTTMGRLTCKFYDKQAPIAVANFIGLAEGTKDWTDPLTLKKIHGKRFYDGTIFHRVIPGFMIQGGDPLGTGLGDPGYMFDDEFDPALTFDQPGRLAMANSGPATNGSQFFITEDLVPQLNGKHTIFGQCDDRSVQLVAAIARVPRNSQDKPVTPVVINRVTIVREGQPIPPEPAIAAPPAAAAPATTPATPR
jgi:peptidyl-prolyl cis-trans isomerase A (cyclophilin A)